MLICTPSVRQLRWYWLTAVVLANCGGIGYTVTLGFRPDGTWEVPSRNNDVQGFTVRQLAATLF